MTRLNPPKTSSVIDDKASAGDPIPPKCAVIEVHVGELKQLFNCIDPAPFRDKDLDPRLRSSSLVGRRTHRPLHRLDHN